MRRTDLGKLAVRWIGFVPLAAALLVAAGCGKGKEAAPPPLKVEVAEVVQRDVPITQEWVGTLQGSVNADIRPKVEGYILKQLYREGTAGQAGPGPLPDRPAAVQGGPRFGQGQPRPEPGGAGQREHHGGTLQAPRQEPGHQPAGAGRRPLQPAPVPGQRGVGPGAAGECPAQPGLDHGHLAHRRHRRHRPDPGGLPRQRPERPDDGLHGGPGPCGLRHLRAAVPELYGRHGDPAGQGAAGSSRSSSRTAPSSPTRARSSSSTGRWT